MKAFRSALFLALATLSATLVTALPPSGLTDFVNTSANLTVSAKFVVPGVADENNLLIGGLGNEFASFSLSDGGYISGEAYVDDPYAFYGLFSLQDDGYFDLYLAQTLPDGFTFTLEGLLPQDGSLVNGFDFFSGGGSFFDDEAFAGAVTISFDAVPGGVTFTTTGNIAADSYFSGSFTAAPVPEPATVALGLAAAAGLFAVWRRRRAPAA